MSTRWIQILLAIISGSIGTLLLVVSAAAQTQPWSLITSANGLPDDRVRAIAFDADKQLWVGTNRGLSLYDRQRWQTFTTADGLPHNWVNALAVDRDGSIWVGTANGLGAFDGQDWTVYTTTTGLVSNQITTLAVDRTGTLWAGTEHGLSSFDGQTWQSYTTTTGLVHERVNAIAFGARQEVWVGTPAGLSHFDGQNWQTYTTADGLASDWVTALGIGKGGQLWVGTHGGGLSLFDDQDWTTYTAADGLLSNVIYDIDLDPSGGIWVGTSGGLNHQVGSRWLGYNQQAGLTGSQVYVLARDPMGFNQWLGTEAGLNRFTVQLWKPNQPVTPTSIAQPISPTLLFAPSKEQPPLIDAEAGRVYVSGQVDEQQQTLVMDADDGRLLARYDLSGPLALDSVHSRLYIEQPDQGELLIIDTQTNQLITTVAIPSAPFFISRGPQVDPISGRVFVTRENVIYIIDPAQGKIVETMTSAITTGGTDTPPRLTQVLVDAPARILYYDAVVHGCFSSLGGDCSTYQIVSYDLTSGQVITHTEGHGLGQVFDGFMVYQDFRCPGASCSGFRALWQDGQPKLVSTNWLDYGGRMVFDPARHRIYEATGEQVRVYEADTLALTMILPQPMSGTLVRLDADQDNLQFWVDGRLQPWPLSDLMSPSAQPLTASPTPTTPVRFAAVSPTWPTDPTLFAAWADPLYAPGQRPLPPGWNERYRCGFPSLLYISLPGNQAAASPVDRWSRPAGGLQDTCGLSTPLAISPDYGQDQTLLAGVDGLGIFKSVDGGQLWRPSGAGLRDMTAVEIELSSDFGRDQTAFARMKSGQLYGSTDGGESWQRLTEPASHSMYSGRWTALALSPEYGLDQTVLAIFSEYNQPDRLYQSTNDGATWSLVADVPERVSWLSPAPLFAKWQTLFAAVEADDGSRLLRSTDGGQSWQAVLSLDTAEAMPQPLLYAAGIEVNRPLFLLADGRLYGSTDGGSTWQPLSLPAEISPTALAISPTFVQDRLLIIGTATGQVVRWSVPDQP